jgi:hypothetical protein
MKNYKGFSPFPKWMTGIIMLFFIYIVYGSMGGIIESTLPNQAANMGLTNKSIEAITFTKNNFPIGIFGLVFAAVTYIFLGWLFGQEEERVF